MKLHTAFTVTFLLGTIPALAQTYGLTEASPSANVIPKNSNTTGANVSSALSDNGTTVSSSEPISAALNGTLGATTPNTLAATTISASGQISSTVSTGTAPLVVASTTNVANLNAASLNGATFAAPGPIGGGTAGSGAFTTLSASGTVSGPGFSNFALLNTAQSWTAPQRTNTETPTISTATFTPNFATGQNHRIVLTTACPCTLANPSAIVAGQSGMFEIMQSSSGSNTIGTWGSEYEYAGGTTSITLSTAANAVDYIPYYVDSTGSYVVLGGTIKGPAH
jgi:hypothetical protein